MIRTFKAEIRFKVIGTRVAYWNGNKSGTAAYSDGE